MIKPGSIHDVVVVGGGIAGLSAAYRIGRTLGGLRVPVLEQEQRVGGTATTDSVGDFVVERGPNGFLSSGSATWSLAAELELEHELLPASEHAKRRYLWNDTSFQTLPSSLKGLLYGSTLLSTRERWRMAAEPLIPALRSGDDESVYGFIRRRLGEGAARTFAGPVVLGVCAGDARRVSVRSLFPRLVELEQEFGSITRGLVSQQLQAGRGRLRKQLTGDSGHEPAPRRRLMSFRAGGMQRLSEAIAASKYVDVRYGQSATEVVQEVDPLGDGRMFRISVDGQRDVLARQVVLATPAYRGAELVKDTLPGLGRALATIPFAAVDVVTMAYTEDGAKDVPRGFGFLVPRGNGIRMLGCQFTDCLYPTQVPAGHRVFRMIYGGTFDPEFSRLSRGECTRTARYELGRLLNINASPALRHVARWSYGIPQYELGHQQRLARIEDQLRMHPGVHIAGSSYYGVAFNDCTADAYRVASAVELEHRRFRSIRPESPTVQPTAATPPRS